MDRGEDDGDSGTEEEQESSSPAPSGLTCRKPPGAVDDSSRPLLLLLLSLSTPCRSPRIPPQTPLQVQVPAPLRARENSPLLTSKAPSWAPPSSSPVFSLPQFPPGTERETWEPGRGAGSVVQQHPTASTHQALFPGAFARPPGRQGCSAPALVRHGPLTLRGGRGERMEEETQTDKRSEPERAARSEPRFPGRAQRLMKPQARPGRLGPAGAQPPWRAPGTGSGTRPRRNPKECWPAAASAP